MRDILANVVSTNFARALEVARRVPRPLWTYPKLFVGCEPVEGLEHMVARFGTAQVSRVFDDDQLGVWPGTVEFPGGVERPAHVEPAVDQDQIGRAHV